MIFLFTLDTQTVTDRQTDLDFNFVSDCLSFRVKIQSRSGTHNRSPVMNFVLEGKLCLTGTISTIKNFILEGKLKQTVMYTSPTIMNCQALVPNPKSFSP